MLEARNLSLTRRRNVVFSDVQASFSPGSLTLILGDNGVGKTSFLHVLACLLPPTQGEVLVNQVPVSRWQPAHRARWRRQVGFAFQRPELLDDLCAMDNLMLRILAQTTHWRRAVFRAHQLLQDLGIQHLAARPVHTLSAGESQRINVARALLSDPQWVLADEPTSAQDDRGLARIWEQFRRVKADGRTVIIATHDPRLKTMDDIDRVWMMDAGRLREWR